jgi:predicted outer membrane repeat protein
MKRLPRLQTRRTRLRLERLENRRVLATYFVDTFADTSGGFCAADDPASNINCSIRDAIEAASGNAGGDSISIPDGTYLLDQGSLDVFDSADVSFVGNSAAPTNVVIDGQLNSRVFDLFSTMAAVIFDGVTIQNGAAQDGSGGGGINASSEVDLRVLNSVLRNNVADRSTIFPSGQTSSGGAIQASGPTLVRNSQLLTNSATAFGGAIDFSPFDVGATLVVEDTLIEGNSAEIDGGGINAIIASSGSSVILTRATVRGNTAEDSGGGLFVVNAALTIDASIIDNNEALGSANADGVGGGVYFRSDGGNQVFSITGTQLTGNAAAGGGGGAIFENADGSIVGTQFLSNSVSNPGIGPNPFEEGGGGFTSVAINRVPTINGDQVTVDLNSATAGAGIALVDTNLNLTNSTISNNTATNTQAGGGGIGAIALGPTDITIVLTGSTVSGNTTTAEGAGIGVVDVNLSLTSVDVLSNQAFGGRGGGIGVLGNAKSPTVQIDQSNVRFNSSLTSGAGLFVGAPTPDSTFTSVTSITGSVFNQNTAGENGGGIFVPGPLTMLNTQVTSNQASNGAGIFFGSEQFGTNASLAVSNSTIAGNVASINGGGVLITSPIDQGPTATFTNVVIENNQAAEGGGGVDSNGMPLLFVGGEVSRNATDLGIESDGGGMRVAGDLTIDGTMIVENTARDFGGGVFYFGGDLSVSNAFFDTNVSGDGGGAFYMQSDFATTADIFRTRFNGNIAASGSGGAIETANFTSIDLTVDNSSLTLNSAGFDGGAIASEADTLRIIQSTLDQNSAVESGGGLLIRNGLVVVENSTFSANRTTDDAVGQGGAIAVTGGGLELRHATLTLNESLIAGGVLSAGGAPVTVGNSIIAGNLDNLGSPDVNGSFTSSDGNLIGDGSGAIGFDGAADQVGSGITPIDPLLGPLAFQDANDFTQTHLPQQFSPAIDRAASTVEVSFDQRGATRPQDGDGNGSLIADIGSIEVASAPLANLEIGDFVWLDQNNNGMQDPGEPGLDGVTVQLYRDSNLDGVLDPFSDLLVASTITSNGGLYRFQSLSSGDYFVLIPEDQFLPSGSPLEAYRTSTGNDPAPDPDLDPSNLDDNGSELAGIGVATAAITLTSGGEPTGDGDNDPDTNLTIDFGFAPTLQVNDDSDSVFLGESVDIPVLSNDSTTAAPGVTITSITQPTFGSVVLNPDNSIRYTTQPTAGLVTDTFTYTATDGFTTRTATVTVSVLSNPADGPAIARDDSVSTDEDNLLVIPPATVFANDSQEIFAGSPVALVIASVSPIGGTTLGTAVLNGDQTITYTPPVDFFGVDRFIYSLVGGDAPATITVNVTPINDLPRLNDDQFNVAADSQLNPLDVLANDAAGPANEAGQGLTIVSITQPASGTASVSPQGDLIFYTPAPGFLGTDSLTYVAVDGLGASEIATVTIDVGPTSGVAGHLFCDTDGRLIEDAGEALVNHQVFLDLNGNHTYDPQEPQDLTDSNGNYRIPISVAGDYNVVTMIPAGCITITPFPAIQRTLGVGQLARSLAAADVDGDGDADLMVASDLSGDVTTLRNESGVLDPLDAMVVGGRPQSIATWQSADLSIAPTIAIADPGTVETGGRVIVMGPGGNTIIPIAEGPIKVQLRDFDSDDSPEILISSFRGSTLNMIRGGTSTVTTLVTSKYVVDATTGDFDGDGNLDIAVAGAGFGDDLNGEIKLLLGRGDGTFATAGSVDIAKNIVDIKSVPGLGSDPDRIVALTKSGELFTLSHTNQVLGVDEMINVSAGGASLVVGLFNGDDLPDVVIAGSVVGTTSTQAEGKLEFLIGTSTGSFVPFTSAFQLVAPSDMVAVDLDGDGIDELAIANLFQSDLVGGGNQLSFPSTVTIFKLNVAVQTTTAVLNQTSIVDYTFAAAAPEVLLDINGDLEITPTDALIIVNRLNRGGEGEPSSRRYDTDANRDGRTTPLDALVIINQLNRGSNRGEAEAALPVDEIGGWDWIDAQRRRKRDQHESTVDQIMAEFSIH